MRSRGMATLSWLRPAIPAILLCAAGAAWAAGGDEGFDREAALARSQATLGTKPGDVTLTDRRGRTVSLADYRGRPLVISPVYTSCPFVCRTTTRSLARAVREARDSLGGNSFAMITVGFDPAHDDPEAMAAFARRHGIDDADWAFLAGDRENIGRLLEGIGFSYRPSPRGFDHMVQTTIVDGDGVIRAQVYGEPILLPQFMEPLKRLVLGVEAGKDGLVDTVVKRIRFFCTNYDPASGSYRFDYSLFIGMTIGALILLATAAFLVRELRRPGGGAPPT